MITNPRKIYYRVSIISNLDGTLDTGASVEDCFDSEQGAMERLEEEVVEYGMTGYIYECKPIIKAVRGKLKLTKLKR